MGKTKTYVKNTIILLIGKFVTQFMSLFLLPLYTHYLLSSDYGLVDLYQTYISLFVPVFLLCLDSAVFRFMIDSRKNEEEQKKILTTSIVKTSKQALILILTSIVLSCFVKINYLHLVIINAVLIMYSNVFLQLCRGLGKNINYSIACIITGFVTLITNLVLIVGLKFNASSILISSSLANFCCICFIFFSLKIYKIINKENYDKKIVKKLTKYSIPLIPNALSWWIVNVSDRTLISLIISTSANGIYTVSCKFSNILNSVFSIFTMSWQETASLHINDEDKDQFFSKMINAIYLLFVLISVVLIFIINVGFDFLVGREYISSYNYIPILILANSFNVLIGLFGGVYIAKKLTKKMTSTTIISAVINLLFNAIFINYLHLYAACLSTLVAYSVMAIYRYFDIQKYVKVKLYMKTILISIICFTLSLISYYSKNNLISYSLFLITFVVLLISNKDIIKKYYRKISKKVINVKN